MKITEHVNKYYTNMKKEQYYHCITSLTFLDNIFSSNILSFRVSYNDAHNSRTAMCPPNLQNDITDNDICYCSCYINLINSSAF